MRKIHRNVTKFKASVNRNVFYFDKTLQCAIPNINGMRHKNVVLIFHGLQTQMKEIQMYTLQKDKIHLLTATALILYFGTMLPQNLQAHPHNAPLIVFLTDYGAQDYYVGAIKGVIYSLAPNAHIDDISHEITPYNIKEGAVTLRNAAPFFPRGTIFCAIVDPGVGTPRKPIAVRTHDGKFLVGPDNGLLSLAIEILGGGDVREIQNTSWFRSEHLSHTFHGRDIFAPVAARLAQGWDFNAIGPKVDDYVKLTYISPTQKDQVLLGEIERIDVYGNLMSNIPANMLSLIDVHPGDALDVKVGTQRFSTHYVLNYGDVAEGQTLCLKNSQDMIECAINQGNLAKKVEQSIGAEISISPAFKLN